PELFELVEDAALVLVLPLPDALDQLLAAEVAARLALLLAHALLHHSLRGDAGVVGAGHPQGVVAPRAPPADQHGLQGVVEGVAHVYRAVHVRRWDDDAVRLAVLVGPAVKVAALVPQRQPALLRLARVVLLGEFGRHDGESLTWLATLRRSV